MQQTNFKHSQSEIRFTKGNVVHFTRPRENNSIEELCILVSHYQKDYLIYCHGHKRTMMYVINSSFELHTLHSEKTI